jgi:hypothetical protein
LGTDRCAARLIPGDVPSPAFQDNTGPTFCGGVLKNAESYPAKTRLQA